MPVSNGRVLLVAPDPMVRLAIDRQLERLGWETLCVNSGREARRVVDLGLHVDVLLADLRLPDGDAVAAAVDICHRSPHVRIAFMGTEAPAAGSEPRHAPFLERPCSLEALADALAGADCLELSYQDQRSDASDHSSS